MRKTNKARMAKAETFEQPQAVRIKRQAKEGFVPYPVSGCNFVCPVLIIHHVTAGVVVKKVSVFKESVVSEPQSESEQYEKYQ